MSDWHYQQNQQINLEINLTKYMWDLSGKYHLKIYVLFITRVGELIISLTCKGILCTESNMFYMLIGDKVYPYLWIRYNQWHSRFWRSTKSPYQKPIGITWAEQRTECHLYNFWKIHSTNSIRINNNNNKNFKLFTDAHLNSGLVADISQILYLSRLQRKECLMVKKNAFFSMDLFILGTILFQFMFS